MRTLKASLLVLLVAAALGGCCSSPCASPCEPAPDACAPCAWADPVYSNRCGGDQGVGRDGTGAFGR